MWTYIPEEFSFLLKTFQNVDHQKAHVLYVFNKKNESRPLYASVLTRFLPKLEQAHISRSSDIVLQITARLSLYAFRTQDNTLLQRLWTQFVLSYDVSTLSPSGIHNCIIIGLLTNQASTKHFNQLISTVPQTNILLQITLALQDVMDITQAIQLCDQHFQNQEIQILPWSDEPLLGVYELLYEKKGMSWPTSVQT